MSPKPDAQERAAWAATSPSPYGGMAGPQVFKAPIVGRGCEWSRWPMHQRRHGMVYKVCVFWRSWLTAGWCDEQQERSTTLPGSAVGGHANTRKSASLPAASTASVLCWSLLADQFWRPHDPDCHSIGGSMSNARHGNTHAYSYASDKFAAVR